MVSRASSFCPILSSYLSFSIPFLSSSKLSCKAFRNHEKFFFPSSCQCSIAHYSIVKTSKPSPLYMKTPVSPRKGKRKRDILTGKVKLKAESQKKKTYLSVENLKDLGLISPLVSSNCDETGFSSDTTKTLTAEGKKNSIPDVSNGITQKARTPFDEWFSNWKDDINLKNLRFREHIPNDPPFEKTYPWENIVESANLKVFGNPKFRKLQRETINTCFLGLDAFLSVPPGGGKSLTYQIPAICLQGLFLVISPLLSIIEDQKLGISCFGLTMPSKREAVLAVKGLLNPENSTKLLYITPERLQSRNLLRVLKRLNEFGRLSSVVIDEAHVVHDWASFRPYYCQLGIIKDMFPRVPLLCVTASATLFTRSLILNTLKIPHAVHLSDSFNLPNILYDFKKIDSEDEKMAFIMDNIGGRFSGKPGIIYFMTCEQVNEAYHILKEKGFLVDRYHSKISKTKRNSIYSRWIADGFNIMCATSALGMGIDNRNVRFVIHHSMPFSVEAYYQETGRAGRDGEKAHALLLYSRKDRQRLFQIASSEKTEDNDCEISKDVDDTLEDRLDDIACLCEWNGCKRKKLLEHFGETIASKDCNDMCSFCSQHSNQSL